MVDLKIMMVTSLPKKKKTWVFKMSKDVLQKNTGGNNKLCSDSLSFTHLMYNYFYSKFLIIFIIFVFIPSIQHYSEI